jgi:hypothetical protein
MKKLFIFLTLLLVSCTVYTEKQSEALSQNVYATNDSVNKGRVDLAYYYSDQTTRLVKIPKHRIQIQSVYEAGDVVKNTKQGEKTQVILVPKQYQNTKVVVVDSTDYDNLLKDKAIKDQLTKDNVNLSKDKINTDKEIAKQKDMNDKMVNDLNNYKALVVKKDLAILWRNCIIIALMALIALYFYAKANGLFFL